jgi:hypothetical protein
MKFKLIAAILFLVILLIVGYLSGGLSIGSSTDNPPPVGSGFKVE